MEHMPILIEKGVKIEKGVNVGKESSPTSRVWYPFSNVKER